MKIDKSKMFTCVRENWFGNETFKAEIKVSLPKNRKDLSDKKDGHLKCMT